MKRPIALPVCVAFLFLSANAQYLQTTKTLVPTPDDASPSWCDPFNRELLTFDPEVINGDHRVDLDLAIAKTVRNETGGPTYLYFQNYNDGTGGFPTNNGTFYSVSTPCYDEYWPWALTFGKLRSQTDRKDLTVMFKGKVLIFYNTGNGISNSPSQTVEDRADAGTRATWGSFDHTDTSADLALSNGGEVRVYKNLNTGYVSATPFVFSIEAAGFQFAQMDKSIYNPDFANNKIDLISWTGKKVTVRLNNQNDNFQSPQDVIDLTNPLESISSVAVGDVNNDGFMDLAVAITGPINLLRLHLNNGSGTIDTNPIWTLSGPPSVVPTNTQLLIGDLGNQTGGGRNDGWNDLFIVGTASLQARVKVLINQGASPYFLTNFQQAFSFSDILGSNKTVLADIENTGGLSLIFDGYRTIWTCKHDGNPAPAPPKNVQVTATPPDQYGYRHPKVTWAANTERDINGYDVWRRITGQCGNGIPYYLGSTSGTEYTDMSIGTAGMGSDCRAWYKVLAKDNAAPPNYSDFSAEVWIDYANFWLKRNGNDGGTLSVPTIFALRDAYPNPFNPSTEIKFDLPEDGFVTLNVFDVLGRKVGALVNEYRAAGYHTATWKVTQSGIASGVYFARFTATDPNGVVKFSKINKLILNK